MTIYSIFPREKSVSTFPSIIKCKNISEQNERCILTVEASRFETKSQVYHRVISFSKITTVSIFIVVYMYCYINGSHCRQVEKIQRVSHQNYITKAIKMTNL